MFMARAMCGLTHVTVAALCCSCSLLCISDSDWATENEAGRWRELSLIQFSCDCNYSLVKHNKTPFYSTWGLLRVCVRPARLPVLTWVPSSVPPGTISKMRSWPGPHRIQHMINIVDKQTASWNVWLLKTEVFFMWSCTVFCIQEGRLLGLHCLLPCHRF